MTKRQKYDICNIFPIRCYTFDSPNNLLKSTLKEVIKLDYVSRNEPYGVGTSDEIDKNPKFKGILDWFQSCIDTIHADEEWHTDRLVVNKTWANRSCKNSGHHHGSHRHPMSFLSAIYYMSGVDVPTVFYDPVDKRCMASLHLDGPNNVEQISINPIPGSLIIFPSYMLHWTMPNNSSEDRYTISFNTFPMGDINPNEGSISLQIDNPIGPLNLKEYKNVSSRGKGF